MSTHPNVVLVLRLTPEGLSRRTMADILSENKANTSLDEIEIHGHKYNHIIMEDNYDKSWQLSGKEGDLLFFELVTYGYGETIAWKALQEQKEQLEEWARGICERHHCAAEIVVTANYW